MRALNVVWNGGAILGAITAAILLFIAWHTGAAPDAWTTFMGVSSMVLSALRWVGDLIDGEW